MENVPVILLSYIYDNIYIYIYIYIGEDGEGAGHARVSHGERLPEAPAREDNPVAGVANVLLMCC
jgi:hypothetical protein